MPCKCWNKKVGDKFYPSLNKNSDVELSTAQWTIALVDTVIIDDGHWLQPEPVREKHVISS
jgi:hypothetical protein